MGFRDDRPWGVGRSGTRKGGDGRCGAAGQCGLTWPIGTPPLAQDPCWTEPLRALPELNAALRWLEWLLTRQDNLMSKSWLAGLRD